MFEAAGYEGDEGVRDLRNVDLRNVGYTKIQGVQEKMCFFIILISLQPSPCEGEVAK